MFDAGENDMDKKNAKIDFVICWVNGADEKWIQKKKSYMPLKGEDVNVNRYRDWETLIFGFRGVEKFAPWVNHIYFISDQQVPHWLNTKNSKLTIVDHTDYIPKKYLPTFSSHPIELNLHRIQRLSETFIYALIHGCVYLKTVTLPLGIAWTARKLNFLMNTYISIH